MPYGLDDWKVEVLKVLGQKMQDRLEQPVVPLVPREREDAMLNGAGQPIDGKAPPETPIEKFFANTSFGSWDDRHDQGEDMSERKKKALQGRVRRTEKQFDRGTAAPVSFGSVGSHVDVALRGTFYAGAGYNLKDNGYQPDTSGPVVLFLGGSGGSVDNYGIEIAERYQEMGASVLTCDYAGFGQSEDVVVGEKGLYEDAQAMLEYLVSLGYRTEDIVIHGYSLGGAIAGNLEDRNEELGNRFRGVVFDRPMTSVKEAAVAHTGWGLGHAAGHWAKTDIGSFSLKKALDRMQARDADDEFAGPAGGRLMTSDDDGLGKKARRQRDARGLGGADTGGGHEDHAAMFDVHEEMFREMLFPDGELPEDRDREWIETQGEAMDTPTPTINELSTLFVQIHNDVQAWAKRIKDQAIGDDPTEEELADGSWRDECLHCLQLIERVIATVDDLERTGLLEADEFARLGLDLMGFRATSEGHGRTIRKRMKNHQQFDPALDSGEVGRLMKKVAVLVLEFDRAGGASASRKRLEDKVLETSRALEKFEALGRFLMEPQARREDQIRQGDWLFQYELLQDAVQEIRARRAAAEQRMESIREATERVNQNLRSRPAEDVTPEVHHVMAQQAEAGLRALRAEGEDVSRRKRLGRRSSDEGYHDDVTTRVEALEPLLQKISRGEAMSIREIQQLEALRTQLLAARTHYFNAWSDTPEGERNSRKAQQRRTKFEAIDNRLRGLGQLIDLADARVEVTQQIEEARRQQIEQELHEAGVFDDFASQLNAVTGDDPELIADLAAMMNGLDSLTRRALLGQDYPPKALVQVLHAMDNSHSADVSDEIVQAHADDDNSDYMHSLIAELIGQEIKVQEPTTLFRGISVCSRIASGFNRTRDGQQYSADAIANGLNSISALDRLWELDSRKLPPGQDVETSVAMHEQIFETLFDAMCQTQVPDDVSRICANAHDTALRHFGPPQVTAEEAQELAIRAAAAHLILRVVNPALMTALSEKTDHTGAVMDNTAYRQRYRNGLIQSKILQAVANEQPFGEKEIWLVPFNDVIETHADRFRALIESVVHDGQMANAPAAETPAAQADPESEADDESFLSRRLRACATVNDLLFEISALEVEYDIQFGFNTAALSETYREVRERVQNLQPGNFSGTGEAIDRLHRLVHRARDKKLRPVLEDRLVRPLAEEFEERLQGADASWRMDEIRALFTTADEFLRMVIRSPDRMADLIGVDTPTVRAMAQTVAVLHGLHTEESERDRALRRLDSFLEQTIHMHSRRYCERVLKPAAATVAD